MSFDELPSDAPPPRLEEGEVGATNREASPSDAPPASSSRRRAPIEKAGPDAASTEPTGAGDTPARSPRRRRAPVEEAATNQETPASAEAEADTSAGATGTSRARAQNPEEPARPARRRLAATKTEPKAETEAESDAAANAEGNAEATTPRRTRRKPLTTDKVPAEPSGEDTTVASTNASAATPTASSTTEPDVPGAGPAGAEPARTSRRRSVRTSKNAAETESQNTAIPVVATDTEASTPLTGMDEVSGGRPAVGTSTEERKEITAEVTEKTPNEFAEVGGVEEVETGSLETLQAEIIEAVSPEIAADKVSSGAVGGADAEDEEPSALLPGLPGRRTRHRSGRNRRRSQSAEEIAVDTDAVSDEREEERGQEKEEGRKEGKARVKPTGRTPAGAPDTRAQRDTETDKDETSEEDSEEDAVDGTAEPRGRRRRNRRNNRSQRETVTPDAVDTANPLSAADTDIDLDNRERTSGDLVAEAVVAPSVPPIVVIEEPIDLTVGAHLITKDGVPRIHINSKPYPPVLFFGNMEGAKNAQRVLSEVRRAAKAGVHLHSTLIELPCPLSEANYMLDEIDLRLRTLLDADPDGYLMPRLVFVPARGWKRGYPTEVSAYSDGTNGDPSLTSTRFWQEAERALEVLIAHIHAQTYGERVFGYHLERGEWFQPADLGYDRSMANRDAFRDWLREKYKNSLILLRAAWYDGDVQFHTAEIPPAPPSKPAPQRAFYETRRERGVIDFNEFTSESTANRLALLGRAVKKASHNNALVSVCYGYTFEFGHNFSGHLALDKLLASPYVDLICGPPSYRDRKPTGASSFPAPIDSPPLHGKLWLSEDDTKTFLAPAAQDPDDFNPRLGDRFATEQAQARAVGRALATNTGIGWMDLWGEGWLDDEAMWERIGAFTERIERQQSAGTAPQSPEVVILIDEKSLLHVQKGELFFRRLTNGLRDTLQRSGAAYRVYLQSDLLAADFPLDARLYLFLTPYRLTSEQRAVIKEKLQRDNKTLAWLYAPGACEARPTGGSGMDEVATGTVGLTLRQQAWNSEIGSRILDPNHVLTERLQGRELGTRERLNPSFYVDDPGATVLAEYQGSGLASVAVRNFGNWKSVFVGDPVLPLELLRGICRYAGVFLYAALGEDVVTIGNGWITVHATRDGQRTLRLPASQSIYDMHERRVVAEDVREYRYFLRTGMTRVFCVGTRERFALLNLSNLELGARGRPVSDRMSDRDENREGNEIGDETNLPRRVERETRNQSGKENERESGKEISRETPSVRRSSESAGTESGASARATFSRIFPTDRPTDPQTPTSVPPAAAEGGSEAEIEAEPTIEPFPEPRRVPLAALPTIVNPSLRADLETLKAVLEMQMPDEDEADETGVQTVTPPLTLPREGLPGLEAVLGLDSLGRRRRRRGGRGRGRRVQGEEETGESPTSGPGAEGQPDE